ncbi:MAG: ComEC/Rec2 family competence protein [Prevotella sp.]|nr:ComEC/Rec2 family competence protein [Prevotella sp.]
MSNCLQKYPMTIVCIAFMLGIVAVGEWFPAFPWAGWTCLLAASAGAAIVARSHPSWQTIFLLSALFALGGMRMVVSDTSSATSEFNPTSNPLRRAIVQRMNSLFAEAGAQQEGSIVVAMSMGEKRDISRDLRADYSSSGAAHVLALSGLHIGIIFFLFKLLFSHRHRYRLTVRQLLAEGLLLAAVWCYVYIVQMPPSAVRAATMVTLYELMGLHQRGHVSLNVLGATVFAMLLIRPADLYDIGFQLSFAAVTAIVVLYPMFSQLVPRPTNRVLLWIWSMLGVSLAAQIGVAPLIAYHFGYISTYSVFSSLVVIPCATIIVMMSVFLIVFLYVTIVAETIAALLASVANIMNRFVMWMASLPGSTINDIHLNVGQVVFIYLTIGCLSLLLALMLKKNKMMDKTS